MQSSAAKIHLIWGSVFISCAILGLVAYEISLDRASDAASRAVDEFKSVLATSVDAAEGIAEKFKTGQITETFRAEIPVFRSAGVGRLELGTMEATETFSRADSKKVAWDLIYLGETFTEISVPVTYRYHLDLGGDWSFSVKEGNCIVHVPELEPSLPVAIHTNELQKKSSNGWARFDANEQLEELQRTITPTLNEYAKKPEHLNNVKENARATVAKFIREWLIRENHWTDGRFTTITVVFPDEDAPEELAFPPTLSLKDTL